jgi:hypothetical protein
MSGGITSGFGTQIAQTAHFLVALGDDTPATRAAAEAIAQTCEADLATLSSWFGVSWDDFPYGIWVSVDVDDKPGPHADNVWFGTSQSPHIEVFGVGIENAAGREDIRDEMARMLFAAELAEVLMNFSGNGWDPSTSNGEGLSRVAAAELHPLGYYRPAGSANNGPYSTDWLKLPFRTRDAQDAGASGPRYDFISVTEDTDQNDLSFGVAALFLYYLHTQLRFSWQQIATSPGGTLADTFAHLTGRPANTAFTEFSDVLNPHLPPGLSVAPKTENPFPLSAHPPVLLYTTSSVVRRVVVPETLFVELSAGPKCHADLYTYHIENLTTTTTVIARSPGAFAPGFSWTVGGVKLPDVASGQTITVAVTIPVTIVVTVPGNKQPPPESGVLLNLSCVITQLSSQCQIDMTNLNFPGNTAPVEISVVMAEATSTTIPGVFNGSTSENLTTRGFLFDSRYYADLGRCGLNLVDKVKDYENTLLLELSRLKGLAHPPPPEQLDGLVRFAQLYGHGVHELLAKTSGSLATLPNILGPAASPGDNGILVQGSGQDFFTAHDLAPRVQ